jgi:hypothetical protein
MYTHPFIFRAIVIALALTVSTCTSLTTTAEPSGNSAANSGATTDE